MQKDIPMLPIIPVLESIVTSLETCRDYVTYYGLNTLHITVGFTITRSMRIFTLEFLVYTQKLSKRN